MTGANKGTWFVRIFLLVTPLFQACASLPDRKDVSIQHHYSICEITDYDTLVQNGERISVRGQIKGYHEIYLFSNDCLGEDHIAEVQLREGERSKLLEGLTGHRRNSNDIAGTVTVTGNFFRGEGRLYTYPARKIEIIGANSTVMPLLVSKISDVVIDEFVGTQQSSSSNGSGSR